MSRIKRFYSPQLADPDQEIVLGKDESHHLASVLRTKAGEEVELFDGLGSSQRYRVEVSDKKNALLRALQPKETRENNLPKVTIGIAPQKRDFDDVVLRLTELGVDTLIPLITRYGEVRLEERDQSKVDARFAKLVLNACKQSGRNNLMKVLSPTKIQDLKDDWQICHPRKGEWMRDSLSESRRALKVLIGPEGGWSEEEEAFFESHSWQFVRIRAHTLRTGTAAIAAATLLLNHARI